MNQNRRDVLMPIDHRLDDFRCGFHKNKDIDQRCKNVAVVHFRATNQSACMLACPEHAEFIRNTHFDDLDEHELKNICGFPGTIWMFSTENRPGYCFIEGLEGLDTEVSEEGMVYV